MRTVVYGKRERLTFGRTVDALRVPNLIAIQLESYREFLEKGLMEILKKFSPIVSQPHKGDLRKGEKGFILEFVSTRVGEPNATIEECKQKGLTYQVPIYATVRIVDVNTGEMREEEAFLGSIPYMTENGTFIINGAERVVVNQLVRAPGVYFVDEIPKTQAAAPVYVAHFLPVRGAWLEILYNTADDMFYARIDRKRRINLFLLLKALGFENDLDILDLFPEQIDADDEYTMMKAVGSIILEDVSINGEKVVERGGVLTEHAAKAILESRITTIVRAHPAAQKTLEKLNSTYGEVDSNKAYVEIYRKLKPGEIPRVNAAKAYLNSLYFTPERFELSQVGRYKINRKLQQAYRKYLVQVKKMSEAEAEQMEYNPADLVLTPLDIVLATRYLLEVSKNPEIMDTKDHLGNKRVRTVGELIKLEFERAFSKAQRLIQERLTLYNSLDKISVQSLINIKTIIAGINQFFATSPLSQFMEQVNPLAELTHKRRLTAVGPGGLKRERARFEVRDVHHSHYGRMCPIETPEGANIGLITSLAVYATVDEFGFLITPYRRVKKGKVTDEIVYLTADEEEHYYIAPCTIKVDENGNIIEDKVPARYMQKILYVEKEKVQFMDVSTKQIVSVSTSLIPFLEHDDANRALMGSNMQRQAVPLLKPEAPFVATGVEHEAALYSGYLVTAKHDGIVKKADARRIVIHRTDEKGNPLYKNGVPVLDEYKLMKFVRTNQDTVINQRPIVNVGDRVKKGEVIADGPATDMGELALGRNVLVAFMSWEGYNFEDAILVSEELLEEDVFTSVHIEVYETQARDTRLGPEEITADIPNVPKESLRNLDENGIVRIGAYVGPQDILVGKVTPKGEGETTPEEKIIQSVFGERGKDVKDTSLRLPHGTEGRVIDVQVFDKEDVAELGPGVNKLVKVYVACKKTLEVGDKLAGRHGNKGVVSKILPREDMPFLPDGTPVQIVLSPLGVPSRMNVGQILETHLGWLAKLTNSWFATPVFDGAKEDDILPWLYKERKAVGLEEGDDENNPSGKVLLRDGRTGEPFAEPVVVGYIYMMKLIHIARDKIHARSTGPYSLIHQQPLGGKAQFGGQRFGEMEVWALEAHGAAHTLNEMLTIKSDDIRGRNEVYKAILKGKNIPEPGIPESFRVLIKELRGLALDVRVYDENGNEIDIDRF
ncbi:DNA-directed RNA polymerase subunit beta [Thermotoga sp. Ku-13t]|uniref:DNA-directed RNA polymerase subunit beta n=1 Tax=Thermotoga sp. Ku-13t TaxID=1755813 RepID=UPI0013EC7C8A|nr:DNA-directed RNA polymerase subunit beta [Thermotoga sp. Ku-13t]KAF2957512.1 DNA-directed RNA polymerase subunit beta [Thermotoga sp. Ku-13t]